MRLTHPGRRWLPRAARLPGPAGRPRRGPGHRRRRCTTSTPRGSAAIGQVLAEQAAGVPDAPAVERHHRPRRGAGRRRLRVLRDPRRRAGGPGGSTSGSRSRRACSGRRRSARAASSYGLRTRPGRGPDRPPGRRGRPRRVGHQLHQPGRPGHRGDVAPPRRPGDRHLRLAGRPRPPGRRAPSAIDPRDAPGSTTRASTISAGCAAVRVGGHDVLPPLLADVAALASFEEGGCSAPTGCARSARSPTSTCTTTTSTGTRWRACRAGRRDPRRVPAGPAARFYARSRRQPGLRVRRLGQHPAGARDAPTWRRTARRSGAGERELR